MAFQRFSEFCQIHCQVHLVIVVRKQELIVILHVTTAAMQWPNGWLSTAWIKHIIMKGFFRISWFSSKIGD